MQLDPQAVVLTFTSNPAGLSLTVGSATSVTPFTRTVIANSVNSVSAPLTQALNGSTYQFVSWSDDGGATHNITAPPSPTTYTATYQTEATLPLIRARQRLGLPRQGQTLSTTTAVGAARLQ